MISLTLFLMAAAGLLLSKRILGDYFSPLAIYTFFWSFALGAFHLDWVAFDPLRDQVWIAIGISYLCFAAGCAPILLYAMAKPAWLTAPHALVYLDRRKFEKVLFFLFVLGILGFLIQLVHLQRQMGLATFLSAPDEARELHTNVKYLGFFNLLNVANFVLALAYLCIYQKPHKWVFLILGWAMATTFITTDRTRFFYMVIWSFFIAAYLYRRIRLTPQLIAGLVSTFILLFGFFLLIAKVYKKQAFDDNREYVRVGTELAPLVDPYIYLTGSFPVLQALLDDKNELQWGKFSLSPMVSVLELISPDLERANLVGKFYRVPIELNACTYLEPFYKDFGMVGIAIGSLLVGFFCTWSYVAMRQRKTLFTVYLSSLLAFCLTISIFVNHFTQTATWFFILVGYAVYRATLTTTPQPETEIRAFIKE